MLVAVAVGAELDVVSGLHEAHEPTTVVCAAMWLASVDGAITPVEEARIPVSDEGLLRGDGGFEVVRVYGGVPFAWDEHLARLGRTCAGLRLERRPGRRARRGGGPARAGRASPSRSCASS